MTYYDDVRNFHLMARQAAPATPRLLDDNSFLRRTKLIMEEYTELLDAHMFGDLIEFADGLADLTYVVLGTAVEAGMPFDPIWNEVHRSNMTKEGGYLDKSGKFIKPPTYSPANLRPILEM